MPTLLQLRDRIKQRTDNEYTDGFVTDGEIDALINLHYKELYELLQLNGLHRVETEFAIAATGAVSYALPVDLFAVFAVFRVESDGTRCYLTRHGHRTTPGPNKSDAYTYRVVGGLRIEFNPTPATGNYVVTYIPIPPDLTDDTDTLDGVLGWEEFVVIAASLDIATKEAVDPGMVGLLAAQLGRQRARIVTAARNAEVTETQRVADVRGISPVLDPDMRHRGVYATRWWF